MEGIRHRLRRHAAAGHVTFASEFRSTWRKEEDLQDVDIHDEKGTISECLLGL